VDPHPRARRLDDLGAAERLRLSAFGQPSVALAGAWDGAQTDSDRTNDWFFIGSGVPQKVRHRSGISSRVLYLGTNDNNPLNGDAKYKFAVNVSVARHRLANVGRAVG
jgi:hypothetical protein